MKSKVLFPAAVCCALMVPALANAQEETVVVEEATITEVPCQDHYYVNKGDNWFLQFGAGAATPIIEGRRADDTRRSLFTANYNFGFGRWFSPYMGFRFAFNGGPLHYYEHGNTGKFNYAGANLDFMWDMFNSIGGVNSKRVVSIVPFVGLGGTFAWKYRPEGNIMHNATDAKQNSWTLPVSGGLQLRVRTGKYVDLFAEARAGFYGDNFNNVAFNRPVDMLVTINGGFTVNIGGRDYQRFNACDYVGYIDNLNGQVNELRGALATTAAALAVAEAQLPCPQVTETEAVVVEQAPLMATVRFMLNSAKISDTEMVNVYNVAQWMNQNADQNVAIVGYADKDTGTAAYNMQLSKKRAQAVYDTLVNKYGINPDRLSITANGSDSQVYPTNNWNRIVIFNAQ